ncbi:hypothetical protein RFX30_06805, partial [Acinetobacter baumannii]|nr:hypothetical protein [Acinetobacter baumannii]
LVVFQYNRERIYKRDLLEARLESYADVVAAEVETSKQAGDSLHFLNLADLLPEELRLTVISRRGVVLYESSSHSIAD